MPGRDPAAHAYVPPDGTEVWSAEEAAVREADGPPLVETTGMIDPADRERWAAVGVDPANASELGARLFHHGTLVALGGPGSVAAMRAFIPDDSPLLDPVELPEPDESWRDAVRREIEATAANAIGRMPPEVRAVLDQRAREWAERRERDIARMLGVPVDGIDHPMDSVVVRQPLTVENMVEYSITTIGDDDPIIVSIPAEQIVNDHNTARQTVYEAVAEAPFMTPALASQIAARIVPERSTADMVDAMNYAFGPLVASMTIMPVGPLDPEVDPDRPPLALPRTSWESGYQHSGTVIDGQYVTDAHTVTFDDEPLDAESIEFERRMADLDDEIASAAARMLS